MKTDGSGDKTCSNVVFAVARRSPRVFCLASLGYRFPCQPQFTINISREFSRPSFERCEALWAFSNLAPSLSICRGLRRLQDLEAFDHLEAVFAKSSNHPSCYHSESSTVLTALSSLTLIMSAIRSTLMMVSWGPASS